MMFVWAAESFAVGSGGGTVFVAAGDRYPAGDPLVKAHPGKFTDVDPETDARPEKRTRRRG